MEARRLRGQRAGGQVFLSKEMTERQKRPGVITWRCFKECQRLEEMLPQDQRKLVTQDRGAKQVYVDKLMVDIPIMVSGLGQLMAESICNHVAQLWRR